MKTQYVFKVVDFIRYIVGKGWDGNYFQFPRAVRDWYDENDNDKKEKMLNEEVIVTKDDLNECELQLRFSNTPNGVKMELIGKFD